MKIVAVDDDPNDREILDMAFTRFADGVDLVAVERPNDALLEMEKGGTDLVLMDINMPGMDGFEAMRMLRDKGKLTRTPLIFLTTSNADKDIRQAEEMGALGFCTKPLGISGMKMAIEQIMELYRRDAAE